MRDAVSVIYWFLTQHGDSLWWLFLFTINLIDPLRICELCLWQAASLSFDVISNWLLTQCEYSGEMLFS